jgi:hypothetical protein
MRAGRRAPWQVRVEFAVVATAAGRRQAHAMALFGNNPSGQKQRAARKTGRDEVQHYTGAWVSERACGAACWASIALYRRERKWRACWLEEQVGQSGGLDRRSREDAFAREASAPPAFADNLTGCPTNSESGHAASRIVPVALSALTAPLSACSTARDAADPRPCSRSAFP